MGQSRNRMGVLPLRSLTHGRTRGRVACSLGRRTSAASRRSVCDRRQGELKAGAARQAANRIAPRQKSKGLLDISNLSKRRSTDHEIVAPSLSRLETSTSSSVPANDAHCSSWLRVPARPERPWVSSMYSCKALGCRKCSSLPTGMLLSSKRSTTVSMLYRPPYLAIVSTT